MSRFRFALRPKWILSHLFVLALIVAMITAGFWQLRRLDEKRTRNTRILERTELAVAPVEDLLAGPDASTKDLEYRSVVARGEYLGDEQVLVANRSLDGQPGAWVIAPLRLDDGTLVLINRGFIYSGGDLDAVPAKDAAPTGAVEVTGLLRKTQQRGSGKVEGKVEKVTAVSRLDIARIAAQLDAPVLPMYVSLESQQPALAAGQPMVVPREALDEGPHFGYAVQWFIFTTIAIVGYPLILRRRANEIEKEARIAARDAETADDPDAEPDIDAETEPDPAAP